MSHYNQFVVYSPTKTWIEKEIVYKIHCRFKQKNCIECYKKVHSFLVFHLGLGITREKKSDKQPVCIVTPWIHFHLTVFHLKVSEFGV